MKKTKILAISDHPLSPSGVGTQTKYFIESLLKTGRYEFVCLGGAVKHHDYRPQKVEPWKDDWRIFPIVSNSVGQLCFRRGIILKPGKLS